MEGLGERFSELTGERETRDALKFLLGLDTKDLLAYTLILKEVHRSTFLYLFNANHNDNMFTGTYCSDTN